MTVPRARNIKHGFFQNEHLPRTEALGRLLFIGLWTLADRDGRLEDRPTKIKAQLFPYEECDTDRYLNELQDLGFLCRYGNDKRQYIQIFNFERHQNPHRNETASIIPAPTMVGRAQEMGERPHADSLNLKPDSLNLDKTLTSSLPAKSDPVPYKKIVDSYHKILPNNPKVRVLTAARKSALKQRHVQDMDSSIDTWEDYFKFVGRSDFLSGRTEPINGKRIFHADLEWITKQGNFAKIYEGKYHGK